MVKVFVAVPTCFNYYSLVTGLLVILFSTYSPRNYVTNRVLLGFDSLVHNC